MRLHRLLPLVALLVLTSLAEGQVYAVHFKSEKVAKKYKKHLVSFGDEMILVGEIRSGVVHNLETKNISYQGGGRNEFWCADPGKPSKVPYEIEDDGTYTPAGRKSTVGVSGQHIQSIRVHLPNQSLYGLAREYEGRLARIASLEEARDSHAKGDNSWFLGHEKLVIANEQLQDWLAATAYPVAAAKVGKQLKKLKRFLPEEAIEARRARAEESARTVPLPEKFNKVNGSLAGGALDFHMKESQHVRLVYEADRVPHGTATELLAFAERLIHAFRVEFVDPYRDDEFKDRLPDQLFYEVWLGPDDSKVHKHFLTEYYGQKWEAGNENTTGKSGTLIGPSRKLYTWRLVENADLPGLIAHGLGHTLAELHYAGRAGSGAQPWLGEAVGYYVSFEFLGRNSVTCFGKYKEKPGRYKKKEEEKKKRGEKPVRMGLREFFNQVALEGGPRIEVLGQKILFELDEVDLAKSWSLYDWIAKQEGREGQLFLREMCRHAGANSTRVARWRESAETLFEVEGEDVFRWLENRWREFASSQQNTGTGSR